MQTIYQEQFGDGNLITSQGILSDIGSYSKEKVAVSELNVNTYFSTENMLPGKAGSTEATNLPDTPQTTACRKGDIVCLFDGRTVYVFDVDNKEKEYQVSNTEEEGTLFTIKENEIFMKIV